VRSLWAVPSRLGQVPRKAGLVKGAVVPVAATVVMIQRIVSSAPICSVPHSTSSFSPSAAHLAWSPAGCHRRLSDTWRGPSRGYSGTEPQSLGGDMAADVGEGAAVASIAQLRHIASCGLSSATITKASER
jgi:hypothetical protein